MMKKILLVLVSVAAFAQPLSSQSHDRKLFWVDIQAVQQVGLVQWSDAGFVNDGLPSPTMTELRGGINFLIPRAPWLGMFVDLGVAFMGRPAMRTFELDRMPLPTAGTEYYMREMLSESSANSASFKFTAGLLGYIPTKNPRLAIMPYLGIGGINLDRRYEMILKEDGTNMQYRTIYEWGVGSPDSMYGMGGMAALWTARLKVRYSLGRSTSLLAGLEYSGFIDRINFHTSFTNTFNHNVGREIHTSGNRMHQIGLSVGIAFM
jgi:hypothetical protein